MRCLHVIPGIAPRYGGPSQVVFQMGRALRGEGAEPLIATTDADGTGRLGCPIGEVVEYQGVQTIVFRRAFSEAFKFSPALEKWLRANVSDFRVAHVHAVFSHSSLAAASACRRRGVPYLVRPLGSLDPWSLDRKALQKRLLRHFGVDAMLRDAGAIHYTSSAEMRLAESRLRTAPGRVIPVGVEPPAPDPALLTHYRAEHPELADRPYVLVLSRLHPKKRLEMLIRAFARATDGLRRQWLLILAGSGERDYVARLRREAEKTAPGRFWFPGWLSGRVKAAVLGGAELAALTSRQENFGVAAAEALVADVPVLLTRHVNLAPEVIEAEAGWVTDLEEGALAAALREALTAPQERRRRGRLGGKWARKRFDWQPIARQLMELYGEMVKSRDLR